VVHAPNCLTQPDISSTSPESIHLIAPPDEPPATTWSTYARSDVKRSHTVDFANNARPKRLALLAFQPGIEARREV
jgi:hypothetical protein